MKCPECGKGELRVTHCFQAHERASTRTRVCNECGEKYTEVRELLPARRRGEGAAAVAAKLRREVERGQAD